MRQITREQAIAELREKLLTLVDDEHSICDVAERHDIFCGGFARWSFGELKQLYPQIVRSHPRLTPQELKDLANRWQLARQFVRGDELACDVQMKEGKGRTCRGWDEFTKEELEGYHRSLCGEEIEIVSNAPAA